MATIKQIIIAQDALRQTLASGQFDDHPEEAQALRDVYDWLDGEIERRAGAYARNKARKQAVIQSLWGGPSKAKGAGEQ